MNHRIEGSAEKKKKFTRVRVVRRSESSRRFCEGLFLRGNLSRRAHNAPGSTLVENAVKEPLVYYTLRTGGEGIV